LATLFLLQARQAARGVTMITDTYPGALQKYLGWPGIISDLAPSVLMELLQEGAMYTPANGEVRAQAVEDVVVGTRYIYTLALALVGLALATCAILFLMIDF
jgi:hypothetical protein